MKSISEEWQEIWDCCADNKLHAIKPTVGGYKRKTSLSRHDCVLINRLRIGHTCLTHSYLLLGDDQPECELDREDARKRPGGIVSRMTWKV